MVHQRAPLVANVAAVGEVEPVPAGVAAPDGAELYVQMVDGIEAIDPDTGETRWASRAAAMPVLALEEVVLALATRTVGDLTWSGVARLVAIDRAEPHASRRGPVFILPQERMSFLDARVADGTFEGLWAPRVAPGRPALATPAQGTVRAELVGGPPVIGTDAALPPAVRRALLSASLRAPAGRGHGSWRAGTGWSAIAMARGVPVLHHWPAEGEPTVTPLLDAAEVDGFTLEHVDRRCAVLRVCSVDRPGYDELRVVDAVVGAVRPSMPAADPEGRLAAPFGVIGDDLLAMRLAPTGRVLVRLDQEGTEKWRRPMPVTKT